MANRESLPEGIRRGGNRKLFVDFQERFPDGTAFRRTKEFEADALKAAINFLNRAHAEFARGNGVAGPGGQEDIQTVAGWCDHCIKVAMPAQKNGRLPKYSDDALEGFRMVVRDHVAPQIGKIRVEELDKKTVTEFIHSLPSSELRAKTLYVLVRVMELAELKGKRKKGTNPCKGVATNPVRKGNDAETPANWTPARPSNWRDLED